MSLLYTVLAICLFGLLFAAFKANRISAQDPGNEKMQKIANAIHNGAMAFLKSEYKYLSVFVIIIALILFFLLDNKETPLNEGLYTAICFVVGAILSGLAGYFGMKIATKANVRTTNAARTSMGKALNIAFSSGAVMGLLVVGLALFGLTGLFVIFTKMGLDVKVIITILTGFAFGASSIALFARVGGGIYTKGADVGADLVGKVEAGIPEDDPRNPAVIADNVGDNVGDVAGMGADLFESYVGSIIAAMIIGYGQFSGNMNAIYLPLVIAAAGILCSIIGTFFVKAGDKSNIHKILKLGLFSASILIVIVSYFLIEKLMPGEIGIFIALVAGLLVGVLIGLITEYYTSEQYGHVKALAESSLTGAATNILKGLSIGYSSTLFPVLVICIAIYISYDQASLYGIAIAAVGMLSTLGISLAIDAYGPVADNAGGIAEMAHLPPEVRKVTDTLDSAGNTTAAIGKGFAIGSAALTALALFSSYSQAVKLDIINILDPRVLIGLLIGGALTYKFSSMTMDAVGKAAEAMIAEVRRQFRDIKGLMQGEAEPEYDKCIAISTKSSLKAMMAPGIMAVVTPVLVGYVLGSAALGGLLAGALVTGVLAAISMANSGGAWDNAKKYIESGKHSGKGGAAHMAAVVGDTVGDPFKDTSGPSINILIKLMTIVSLLFASIFTAGGIL